MLIEFALAMTVASGLQALEQLGGTPPKGNLASFISQHDYPAAAGGASGMVDFELGVNPQGRITNCTITRSSGTAALDATTCRLLARRARLHPATDSTGQPVAGSVRGKIMWKPPVAPPSSNS